jgi:restriction endonuclease S subunit
MNQTWKHVLLGEVFESITNGVNCDQRSNTGKQLVTRIETISKGVINLERIGRADLTEKDLSKYRMKENDILFSHINSPIHVGKTALFDIDEEVYHGVNLLRIRTIKEIEPKFLRYFLLLLYLSGFWRTVAKQSVNQASVNQKDISSVPFSYPPLEKQREIVKRLDGAFAEIELLEGNFASMESLINVCDAAILGQTLRLNLDLPMGHRNLTLGDATDLISRGISPTYLDSATTVVLNQRCIRDGLVDLNFSRRHDDKVKKVQETKLLKSGDGLINSTGVGTLGRTALFDHPGIGEFTVDSHLTIVRPKSDILDSDYFGLVLKALENVFVSLSTGSSGQTELPREAIKGTEITFPENLDDQKRFFKYYRSLYLEISEFCKVSNKKRVLTQTLRTSFLSSAFAESEEVA